MHFWDVTLTMMSLIASHFFEQFLLSCSTTTCHGFGSPSVCLMVQQLFRLKWSYIYIYIYQKGRKLQSTGNQATGL